LGEVKKKERPGSKIVVKRSTNGRSKEGRELSKA